LGSDGLLGSELRFSENLYDWEIIAHARSLDCEVNADLSQADETRELLDTVTPDVILNLVGMTDVDRCEAFPDECYVGNVKTIDNVVSWIKQTKGEVYLVHISTDQVYDGEGPHSEIDLSLRNYYAFSKYAGELVVSSVESVILRTNFFGKSRCKKRSGLTDWLFTSLKSGISIQVFDDILFSPVSMRLLSRMIALILERRITGTYNLGTHQGLSKAEFAFSFAKELNLPDELISRVSTNHVKFLKTYRPKDMRLNVSHFEHAMGIQLPNLIDEIKEVAKEYSNET